MSRAVFDLQNKWGGTHTHDFGGKLKFRRIRLNSGGYDSFGRYYGVGAPVWQVTDRATDGNEVDFTIRAVDMDAAREKVQDAYPGAKKAQRKR